MNLASILEKSAKNHPFKRSVISGKSKISYAQLNLLANQLASFFIKHKNLKKQSKIAILHENSINYLVALFAIAKAGMISVPLNTFLKPSAFIYILNGCEVELLISSSKFQDSLGELKKRTDSLRDIVITDEKIESFLYLEDILDKECKNNLNEVTDETEVALISYTSSTTGSPKGVMLSHKNLISNINSCLKAIEVKSKDCFLMLLPMFHSFTLTASVFLPIKAGARLIILQSMKPVRRIIKTVIFNRITILVGIPQLFRILNYIKLPKIYSILSFLNPLRLAISGAAPLDKKIASEFMEKYKIKLLEGYGLAEASPVVSINPVDKDSKLGSVGLPLPGIEVKVIDVEESELPPNEVGELIVRGPNVMKGYYNMPYETAEAIKGGWLFTGDLAKIDKDGYIYIVDRKKDLIISHGMNIYPREIEEVIELHPKVKEVAVIGKKDKHKGEVTIAIIVTEENATIKSKEIIEHCKDRLANYKVPHIIEIKEELPKTPTGKVLKRKLREEYKSISNENYQRRTS